MRRGRTMMMLALAAGLLLGCAPTPFHSNLLPLSDGVALQPNPQPNYTALTFATVGTNTPPAFYTRDLQRAEPTYAVARLYGANDCTFEQEVVDSFGGLFGLGDNITAESCGRFVKSYARSLQPNGRLFPAAVGNTLEFQYYWFGAQRGNFNRSVALRVEGVYNGIALNGMRIEGPVYLVSKVESGSQAEPRQSFLWSELLGHWVVRESYDQSGAPFWRVELVGASGVQPRSIGGRTATLQGSTQSGVPARAEQQRMFATFIQRADTRGVAAAQQARRQEDQAARRAQRSSNDAMLFGAVSAVGGALGSTSRLVDQAAQDAWSAQMQNAEDQARVEALAARTAALQSQAGLRSLVGPPDPANPTAPTLNPPAGWHTRTAPPPQQQRVPGK